MKSRLSPKEREEFNASIAAGECHLQDKNLDEEKLSGIALKDSTIKNVDMVLASLASCRITRTVFEKVDFGGADLSGAALSHVEFSKCQFVDTRLENAALNSCTFRDCKTENLRTGGAVLMDCSILNSADTASVFEKMEFSNCRLQDSELSNTSFFQTKLQDLQFSNCRMHNLTFSEIRGTQILIAGGTTNYCGFEGSDFAEITLNGCKSTGITFTNFKLHDLKLLKCSDLRSLAVLECDWGNAKIESCPLVSELRFHKSNVNYLSVLDCKLVYFDFRESNLSGGGSVRSGHLLGANLSQSQFHGLVIENCGLEDYLVLNGARFTGLSLKNVKYGAKIEIIAQDVEYEDSDKFRSS